MRILHVVGSADRGGAERYVEYAVRATLDLEHAVLALAGGPTVEAWRRAGAEVEVIEARGKAAGVVALGRIVRTIRRLAPDVVACHATKANVLGASAARLAGVPRTVVFVHGGPRQYGFARALPEALYAGAERFAATAAHAVVAVSAATRDEIVAAGVPAGRVEVVPTGVPDPGVPPLTRLDPPRVLFLGRFSPEKGADLLAPIAARLETARRGRFRFYVAGDGPMRSVVEAALAEFPDVRFRGPQDDEGVARFLRGASIAVLPSRAEGLPLVLLEAMGHGLAVVATTVGGIPEALGDAGVLVPPEDTVALAAAIERLLDDPGERVRLGAAARGRYLERFALAPFGDRLRRVWGAPPPKRCGSVAAVLVAHGPSAPIEQALVAARVALGDRLVEAVVVDNASPDDPAPAARAQGARLLRLGANLGFAAGAAAGAAATSAPYLLFLNPDAEPVDDPPGAWAAWVDRFEADGGAAAQGPRTVGADGRTTASVYGFPSALRTFAEASGLSALRRRTAGPRALPLVRADCDYAQGSCLLVRRSAWEDVGPYDAAYFLYHEEMDWAYRARRAGWRIVYDPGAACRHLGGIEVPPGREPLYWSGLARFAGRHAPRRAAAFRAAIRAGLLLGLPFHIAAGLWSGRARARAAGTLRALAGSLRWG